MHVEDAQQYEKLFALFKFDSSSVLYLYIKSVFYSPSGRMNSSFILSMSYRWFLWKDVRTMSTKIRVPSHFSLLWPCASLPLYWAIRSSLFKWYRIEQQKHPLDNHIFRRTIVNHLNKRLQQGEDYKTVSLLHSFQGNAFPFCSIRSLCGSHPASNREPALSLHARAVLHRATRSLLHRHPSNTLIFLCEQTHSYRNSPLFPSWYSWDSSYCSLWFVFISYVFPIIVDTYNTLRIASSTSQTTGPLFFPPSRIKQTAAQTTYNTWIPTMSHWPLFNKHWSMPTTQWWESWMMIRNSKRL